jgi:predicted tellurium resistance membrane protein TerC
MARDFWVMAVAIVIAMALMLFASGPIMRFINGHPTVKMLALAFVLLIGMALVADGFEFHIPKGYLYAAMAFSVFVEALNVVVARGASVRKRYPGGARRRALKRCARVTPIRAGLQARLAPC